MPIFVPMIKPHTIDDCLNCLDFEEDPDEEGRCYWEQFCFDDEEGEE